MNTGEDPTSEKLSVAVKVTFKAGPLEIVIVLFKSTANLLPKFLRILSKASETEIVFSVPGLKYLVPLSLPEAATWSIGVPPIGYSTN